MRGFAVFLGKEFTEIVRTWRLYVIPGIMLFVGLMSPVFAEVTPGLVSSMVDSQGQGIVLEIPPATTVDSYLQFSKNATQIALIAVIIATAGVVSGEHRSGTAQLVLTKPVSRGAMIAAKALSNWLLLLLSTAVSAALCFGVTLLIFDSDAVREFASMVGIWYTLASLMVALTIFLSVLLRSQPGAAGAGIGTFFVISVLSMWGPARDYSPAGLVGAGDRILTGTADVAVLWPVVSAVALSVALVAAAAWVFGRQEL